MRWMLLKTDNLLLKVEILAILLLVILPNFTRESVIDFTWSSFLSLGISRYRRFIDTTSAVSTWIYITLGLNPTIPFFNFLLYWNARIYYIIYLTTIDQFWLYMQLPPHYLWMNFLERAVSLYLIILYQRATNFSGIAFGFYLMSTICSSSIAYFMPTRRWRGLLNNPNPKVSTAND